jgi:hypothetical protein
MRGLGALLGLTAIAATSACTSVLGISDYEKVDCVGDTCVESAPTDSSVADVQDSTSVDSLADVTDSTAEDTSSDTGAESSIDSGVDTSPSETSFDSASDAADADTSVVDSSITDTMAADTMVADTMVADTVVADTTASCDASTATDPMNCGTCGHVCTAPTGGTATCTAGRCGYTADASDVPGFWTIAPSGGPFSRAAADDTGRILIMNTTGSGPVTRWVDPVTKTTTSILATGGPSSVVIGPATTDRFIVGGYQDSYVHKFDGTRVYTWAVGCCNVNSLSWAIDPVGMKAWIAGHYGAIARWNLTTGAIDEPISNPGATNGFATYLNGANTAYSIAVDKATRWNLATLATSWNTTVFNNGRIGVGAIASDGSFIVATPQASATLAGSLQRLDAAGAISWSKSIGSSTSPVLTAGGVVIVGLSKVDTTPAGVIAYDLASGSERWSITLSANVGDILVGDKGLVWVMTQDGTASKLLGLVAETGATVYEIRALPAAAEMLLEKGVIYWLTGGSLYAIPVESTGYDSASAWPVKQHDNQRTSNRTAPLTY